MKKFIFVIILLLSFSIAEASTFYNIRLKGNDVLLNTTLVLESKDPISIWEIVWSLPENSSVISVRDDIGEIKDYTISDKQITFSTHFKRSNTRYVYIDSKIENAVSDEFKPIYSVELSLSGLPDTKTVVEAHLPNVISGYASFGFVETYNESLAKFEGVGPVGMKVYYSFSGEEYDNFIVFGDYDATLLDQLYSIVPNVTGVKSPFEKFPLMILTDEEFDKKINDWAAGTHLPGGLIVIRESTANGNSNVSIILHEVTHGHNAKIMSWDQTGIVWFDEGMGEFIEYLVNIILGVQQPSLFGKETVISEGGKSFILLPKGDINDLWDYYQNDLDFMRFWNTKNPTRREFGYAFSELVIRDYVKTYGIESVKTVYQELAKVDHTVSSTTEHNTIILDAMNYNLKPCFSHNYDNFVACIEVINEFTPTIPGFSGEVVEPKKITIEETPSFETPVVSEEIKQPTILDRFLITLRDLVASTVQKIGDLFR